MLFDPDPGANHRLTGHEIDQGQTQNQWQAFDTATDVALLAFGFAPIEAARDLNGPLPQRWVWQGY
ncbi:hypothetical protein D1872_339610 [compost metagenome]